MVLPAPLDKCTEAPIVISGVGCVGGGGTKHRA
jgi:hypothetical protein